MSWVYHLPCSDQRVLFILERLCLLTCSQGYLSSYVSIPCMNFPYFIKINSHLRLSLPHGAGAVAQRAECLPSIHNTLVLVPSISSIRCAGIGTVITVAGKWRQLTVISVLRKWSRGMGRSRSVWAAWYPAWNTNNNNNNNSNNNNGIKTALVCHK